MAIVTSSDWANAYKQILDNQDIRKLLYYPSDNFDDDPLGKADVPDATAQEYIKKIASDYLIQVIEDVDGSSDKSIKRGYMTVFSEDYERGYNPHARNEAFRVEIYMPIRKFEEYQYRIDQITSIYLICSNKRQ